MGDGRGNGASPFRVEETPKNNTPAEKPNLSFDQIMKDGPRQAPVTEQPRLTQEAYRADALASQTFQQYSQLSENGAKPVSTELFNTIKGRFDSALTAANTLTPRLLTQLEGQAALDLAKVIPDSAKQQDAITKFTVAERSLQAALSDPAFTQEQKQKAGQIEQAYTQEVQRLQAQYSSNPQAFQQEVSKAAGRMIADQKANNPKLGAALEAQMNLLSTQEGQAAQTFMATMGDIERLRHSGATVKFFYAQVLEKQGGTDNIKRAGELLADAAKDEQIRNFIDTSPEAQSLAMKLGVKTPNMETALAEVTKKFPELVEMQKALDLIADKSKDPKTAFAEAQKHFENALSMTDDKGSDALDIAKLVERGNSLQLKLKDNPNPDPKEAEEYATIQKKIENVALIRFQYATALNHFGHDQNDAAAKARCVEVLNQIAELKSSAFMSPEVQGALAQANAGKRIDVSSAVSQALVKDSARVISAGSTGLVDTFLPGTTPALGILTRPLGVQPSDIPLAGPVMFGDSKKADDAAVRQLASAYLNNADATQKAVDTQVGQERSMLRELGSDAAAIGAGFGVRYLTQGLMKGPWYAKGAGLALQLTAAGATKDFLADGEMLTTRDWLRGSGMYGLSLATWSTLSANPSRQVLSEATTSQLGTRFGVTGLQGTSLQVGEQLAASQGAGSLMSRIGYRLNPLSYTGYKAGVGFVGFGTERTAQALANGTLSLAEFNVRRSIGSFGNWFASGYMMGAGREALYISTGKTNSDGTPYTWTSALSSVNGSGLQGGFTASLIMPFATGFARGIPGVSQGLNGTSSLLGRISPAAPGLAKDFVYLGAAPALAAVTDFHHAGKLEDLSLKARQMAKEAEDKARGELK